MTVTSMAPRFISFLLLILVFGISPLLAQGVTCPEGSSLHEDSILFTVSTTQQKLLHLLGDFFSPQLQNLIFRVKITSSPPERTLNYPSLILTERLISSPPLTPDTLTNGFDLSWELTSGPLTPPSLTSSHKVTYYTQSTSLRPVCTDGSYSSITWHTAACISNTDTDAATTLQWFASQHRIVAQNIFSNVAGGWFGGIESDPEGNNCGNFDTRVSTLPTISGTSSFPTQTPVRVPDGHIPGGEDAIPTQTETYTRTYLGIPGTGTGTGVSWPAGGTPTKIGIPVEGTATATAVGDSVVNPTATSLGMSAGDDYQVVAGAGRMMVGRCLGLVLGVWAGIMML